MRKVLLITWSSCLSSYEFLRTFTQKFKIISNYLGSGDGFRSDRDNLISIASVLLSANL